MSDRRAGTAGVITLSGSAADTVPLLGPCCRTRLEREAEAYRCAACGRVYPITGGIVRMLPPLSRQEQQTREAFDFEHRRYQRARYLRIAPEQEAAWLADVQLPAGYFAGKTVLDAGCGSGRWTYAMARLGARVTAVDLSEAAVEITRQATRGLEVTVVQASLFHLPFQAGQFDFVVSWGVLHHTRDTASAFRVLAPLVRGGGHLYVMVYERRNPVKVLGTELLRMVLRRLPAEQRYRVCGKLVLRNRFWFHLLRGVIACIPATDLSPTLDQDTAQFGLYDWYSPRYNHVHSVGEVRGWFEDAGFDELCLTTPIKHRRLLDVLRYGECGGSISLRGRRRLTGTMGPTGA